MHYMPVGKRLGIVRISSLALRPSGVILRNVRASVFPYPQPFKLYIGPRQSRRKVNHHTVKLSICYRTKYLAWEGGGYLSVSNYREVEESITMLRVFWTAFRTVCEKRPPANSRVPFMCLPVLSDKEMMDQKYFLLS